MTKKKERKKFEEQVFERDNYECIVPWCDKEAVDAHHIIERDLWENEGYFKDNGVSVCSLHHKYAESSKITSDENEGIEVEKSETKTPGYIPPQAFWWWIKLSEVNSSGSFLDLIKKANQKRRFEPKTPDGFDLHIDKWGNKLEKPPWKEHRQRIKYPSTRHLPFSNIGDDDDTYFKQVDSFIGMPLIVTHKMDGSNAMILKDDENPVRARNGKDARHQSFSMLKSIYDSMNIYSKLPNNLQVFGEWLYAKHSIHYGCDCEEKCEDVGPKLADVIADDISDNEKRRFFQVFGVYETEYDIWLSWPEVKKVSEDLGFPTVPVIEDGSDGDLPRFENERELYDELYKHASDVVKNGGEGIVIRSKFPFHYGNFSRRVGKYVRKNHVKTEEHWRYTETKENK